MNKPAWLDNKTATIFGIIFFAPYVILSYRFNALILSGTPLSGGRFFWREIGWTLACSVPLVGWIYGFVNLENIVATRNILWGVMANNQMAAQQQAPQQPPPPQA